MQGGHVGMGAEGLQSSRQVGKLLILQIFILYLPHAGG